MGEPTAGHGFQQPRFVASPEGCYFYHTIDLPGFGIQRGHWDLRKDVDDYLGRVPLAGRTVVDVGAASGYVSLEMEKRGAEVIAFDRDLGDVSDDMGLLPYADWGQRFGISCEEAIRQRLAEQRRLQDSFWLAHRLFGSKVRLYCGNVYEGLEGVAGVDVSFFGCILLHLRDPLLALTRFARITRETLVITDTVEDIGYPQDHPVMFLRANVRDKGNAGTWWYATPKLYQTFLEVLGFRHFKRTEHRTRHEVSKADVRLMTLVASR